MWKLIQECWKQRDEKQKQPPTIPQDADALVKMLPSKLQKYYENPAPGERSDGLVRTLLYLAIGIKESSNVAF